MDNNQVKKVVLVGAGGNAGSAILEALLAAQRFDVTILSRPESKSSFPDHVRVVKGTYDDEAVLKEAFQGADALVITLSFMSTNQEPLLIKAANKAGVKWIIPNEYAGDGNNTELVKRVPVYQQKQGVRQLFEHLDSKFLAMSTGPWTGYSIVNGGFGIDVKNKKVLLATGAAKFNASTLEQLGKAVAALLSLPVVNTANPDHSLSHYANSFVYVSSMYITQVEVFEAVRRATGTQDRDWTIEHEDLKQVLADATAKIAAGDMSGMRANLFYNYIGEGLGGDVEAKAAKDGQVLGLRAEDLDVVVRQTLQQ